MKRIVRGKGAKSAAVMAILVGATWGVAHVGCSSDPTGGPPAPGAMLDLDSAPRATSVATVAFARAVGETIPAGESMLVLYEDTGVGVVDMNDPKSPEIGAQIATTARVVAADYDEERQLAFLVDASGTVTVVGARSASGAATLLTTKVPELGAEAKAIARVGDRLFVLGASRLFSLRLTFSPQASEEPSALTAEAPVPLPGAATHLAAGGDALYLGQGSEVRAWTVPAAGAPTAGAVLPVEGELRGLLAKGSKLLVLAKNLGLEIVDFANPGAPARLQRVPDLKDVSAAKLFGRTLVVGLERGSFHTVDLSDFTKPRVLTTNKGELPKFLSLQGGNVFFGRGTSGEAAGVPPVVAAAVPSLQRDGFPLDAPMPVVFSKPVDPASARPDTVKLQCGGQAISGLVNVSQDRLTVVFRPAAPLPAGASCTLDLAGVRDAVGLEVSGAGKVDFTTSSAPPAPVANAGSAYKHTPEGAFSDWTSEAKQFEWFDVKPAKGMYSYFYADFDGQSLWLLNDWFFAGEKISPDCYNQFGVWTGGGKERWDIRAYGNQKIEVRKNGELLDDKASGVEGGYSFGASPNASVPHTIYELKIPASSGGWGVQLHDPGPTFDCSRRMGDPSPLQGGLGGDGPRGSTVERAPLAVPTAPTASAPENGRRDVAVDVPPTLVWGDGTSPRFVTYVVELARDESFKRLLWQRATYGTSLRLPRGLLVGGQTYHWRVRAWSWVGSATSPAFSFTTIGTPPKPEGDAGPDATVTDAGEDVVTIPDASADSADAAKPDGGACGVPRCVASLPGQPCSCFRTNALDPQDTYAMECTMGGCFCRKNRGEIVYGGTFGGIDSCLSAATLEQLMQDHCGCPYP